MNICLYGSSSATLDEIYYDAAYELGTKMAERGHTMVFGGGAQGVMGAAARGVFDHGGKLIGIAPTFFHKNGILFEHCTELLFTETMQERKKKMMELSDAFVMAPGGFGTFEEFFEVLTLKQLGRHNPALAMFNVNGYYDPLQAVMEHTVRENFAAPVCLEIYRTLDTAEAVLSYLEHFDPAALDVKHIKNL